MAEDQVQNEVDKPFQIPGDFYTGFTENARASFNFAVQEYAHKLRSESTGIEKMEHTGDGSAEITGAHVEEAKWVLIRRSRRYVAHSKWIEFIRIAQALVSFIVGVGVSDLSKTGWQIGCFVGVLFYAGLKITEYALSHEK